MPQLSPLPSTGVDGHPARSSPSRLLAEPNFRRLWMTQIFSSGGEALSRIALPLLVYDLTSSPEMVGLIALVLIFPQVLLAPITGLLADHLDRRRLMIAADLFRLVLVALIPFTTEIWQLAVLTVLVAVGNATGRPAELAAVPSVAGPERLVAALSLIQVSGGIIRIAAPAAGAGIIALAGPAPVFLIQALCFAGSLIALRRLVIPAGDRADAVSFARGTIVRTAGREMLSGIRAIRDIPIVRGVTASESLHQIAVAAMTVAGIVYTEESLDLGDRAGSAYALMTTSMAAGAVLGAFVAHRVERRTGRPRMMALGYLGPFFLMAAFVSPPMAAIYAAWFCFGFLDALAVISFQAYLAGAVPERLRGRVYAAWGAVIALASALAYQGMGLITPVLGAPYTIALVGLIVGIGGPLSLWVTGAIRSVQSGTITAEPPVR
ncbi:MAG TPA: MFS transporter [Thermomicrobiales bacterium]|nr:MFS transporter [Thermomicrobiales bacterium]